MEAVFKRRHNAEIAAAAAQAPEQVRVLGVARGQQLAIGGDHIGGEQVVAGKAVEAIEPAQAATQREAGDARGRKQSPRGGQPEGLRFAVKVAPGEPGLSAHRPPGGVNADALHGREIQHQPAIADGIPGHVVPAATDRHQQVMRASELHAGDDIGGASAAGDQCRPPVNHGIIDRARGVVAVVAGAGSVPRRLVLNPCTVASCRTMLVPMVVVARNSVMIPFLSLVFNIALTQS